MNQGRSIDNVVRGGKPPIAVRKRAPLKVWQKIALGVIIIALLAGFIWWKLAHSGEQVQADRYQAVFLDDGKVFFGKVKNLHGEYVTLQDVYYTQEQQSGAAANKDTQLESTSSVSLVKVGDEVYGPESSMNIRANQILFWQNLKSDSKVAQAIASQSK